MNDNQYVLGVRDDNKFVLFGPQPKKLNIILSQRQLLISSASRAQHTSESNSCIRPSAATTNRQTIVEKLSASGFEDGFEVGWLSIASFEVSDGVGSVNRDFICDTLLLCKTLPVCLSRTTAATTPGFLLNRFRFSSKDVDASDGSWVGV